MKKISTLVIAIAVLSIALISCNEKATTVKSSVPANLVDSVSYALGVNIGANLKQSGFENINTDMLAAAINGVYADDSMLFTPESAGEVINSYMMIQSESKAQGAKQEGIEFMSKNAAKEGVVTTASGLQYEVVEEGTGASPIATDMVTVHYHGTLIDGTVFDSSVERGEPAQFPLNGVIPGWTEGLQLMKEGGKTRFYIPSDLAYGDRGASELIGPGATLIFDVELIKVGE